MHQGNPDSAREDRPAQATADIHPLLAIAFRVLDEQGHPWMLLRGADDLVLPTGDVDILIDRPMKSGLDEALRAVGFYRVISAGRGTHTFFFAHDVESDDWLKLDVVSDLAFGPYQQWKSPLARGCLHRRTREGSIYRPHPADESWLDLLHLVLDRTDLTQDRVPRAQAAANAAPPTWVLADFVDRRLGEGAAEELLSAILSADRSRIAQVSARLRTAWTRSQPIGTRSRVFTNRAKRFVLPPTVSGRRFRGLTVALPASQPARASELRDVLAARFPAPTKFLVSPLSPSLPAWSPKGPAPGRLLVRRALALLAVPAARFHVLRGRLVVLGVRAAIAASPATMDGAGPPAPCGRGWLVPAPFIVPDPVAGTASANEISRVVDSIWLHFVGAVKHRR